MFKNTYSEGVIFMILLYIDPGTGSMLFSVLLGVFTALLFTSQKLFIKLKTAFLGGMTKKTEGDKIPVVIFSDSKRYWNTFDSICEELDKRGIYTEYWTESEDDPAFLNNYENIKCIYIGNINRAITRLNVMNAQVCLSTTPGLDVYQWKRSKNTDCYIHIFHSVSSGVMYRMFGLDFYDTVMLPGDSVEKNIRKLERMRNLPGKEMVMVGIPYLDKLESSVKVRQFKKNDNITLLLAPTWGVNSLFNQMGDNLIDEIIATGFNIIIRPHPQSYISEPELINRLKDKYPENERLHWNSDNDNIEVLGASDIMISDYSGVIYDFAFVFDKPVIYFLPEINRDPYDAWFIEEEPETIAVLRDMAVSITKDNLGNIKEMIDAALVDNDKKAARAMAREKYWYNHGLGAQKCVDYIESKLQGKVG